MTLEEFSVTYIEDYAMARNKKGSWKRKKVSLRALNKVLRKQNLESQHPPPSVFIVMSKAASSRASPTRPSTGT